MTPSSGPSTPLAAALRQRGMTAFDLSKKLTELLDGPHVDPKTCRQYTTGRLTPSRDRQVLIAQLINHDQVEDLFPDGARLRRVA